MNTQNNKTMVAKRYAMIAIAALIAIPVFSQQKNEAKQLIKQVVKANGGIDNFQKIKDVSYDYYVHNEGKNQRENSTERYIFESETSWAKYSEHESFIIPDKTGEVINYDSNGETYTSLNGVEQTDEKTKFVAHFFRRANMYWFSMMFKLLDDGTNYKLLKNRSLNSVNYKIVEMTFNTNTGEFQDKFLLYINPKTNLIDQFLFNVQAFNIQEPLLMRVKYQDINGIKIMNYRELTGSNWNGDVIKDEWTKEISTNIKFNNGFTKEQLNPKKSL